MGSPNLLSGLQAGDLIERERLAEQQQRQSGAQQLFQNLLKVQEMKRQAALDAQNKAAADEAASIAHASMVQRANAATPMAQAPGETATEAGITPAPVTPDAETGVAPEAAGPTLDQIIVPRPGMVDVKMRGGTVSAPAPYQEQALANATKQAQIEATAKGVGVSRVPMLTLTDDDEAKGLGEAGTEVPAAQLISARAGLVKQENAPDKTPKWTVHNTPSGGMMLVNDRGEIRPLAGGMGGGTGEGGIEPGNPESIPQADRQLVIGIAEGRIQPPNLGNRPGSPGYRIMQMVMQYDPSARFDVIKARWQGRQELAKASNTTSRGGQIDRLNQFAGHIEAAQKAADEMSNPKTGHASSDIATRNAIEQFFTPSGKQGDVSTYKTAITTAVEEYVAAITGGRPTRDEINSFLQSHPTVIAGLSSVAGPGARNAAIAELKKLAADRANQHEDWYQRTFGRPSGDDPSFKTLFGRYWQYNPDTSSWTVKAGTAAKTPPGAESPAAGRPAPATPAPTGAGAPPPGIDPEVWKRLQRHM